MDDRINRRFRASQKMTQQMRSRADGHMRGYNGDLTHMFLARTKRTANHERAGKKTLNRMPPSKRTRSQRDGGDNRHRVKRMKREHNIPGVDSFRNDLPPSRSEMRKRLKELKDVVEEDIRMEDGFN